jgi:hypothetical protein
MTGRAWMGREGNVPSTVDDIEAVVGKLEEYAGYLEPQ